MHRDPVKSESEHRQDECIHRLEPVNPEKEHGFRWHCVKCGKWLYRKNGTVIAARASRPR